MYKTHTSKALRLLLLSIVTMTAISTFAQNRRLKHPEIYYGMNAGYSGAMVMFNPQVNQTYTLGYHAGGVFRYINEKHFGLQTELNFTQRGWKEADGLFEKRLNYLELPFMTHFYAGNNFRVFFNIGPKIGYLISESNIINLIEGSDQEQHLQPIENPFDYGLCASLGFLLRVKKQVFQVDFRGAYSLSNIYSNEKADYFDNSNNLQATATIAWLIQTK